MKYYPQEPVGVVGTYKVTKTYIVTVYADREDELDSAIEDAEIKEEDWIDTDFELQEVDSAGF